jgi:hypothetical protein
MLEPKKHHPAFDRLVGGGWGFDNLAVLIVFWFDESVI